MATFSKAGSVIACVLLLSLALAQPDSSTNDNEKLVGVCAETNPGDTKITLECPPGTILKKMKAASWGQSPGSCPAVRRHSKCTLDITDFMERYCLQSNKCPVTVKKEILGFPVDNKGQECLPTDTPFTFVASFYCGIAGWNDVAPSSSNVAPAGGDATAAAADMNNMGSNDTTPTSESESESKQDPSSALAAAMSAAAVLVATTILAVIL